MTSQEKLGKMAELKTLMSERDIYLKNREREIGIMESGHKNSDDAVFVQEQRKKFENDRGEFNVLSQVTNMFLDLEQKNETKKDVANNFN